MNWINADVIVLSWFFPVVMYGLVPLLIGCAYGAGWLLRRVFSAGAADVPRQAVGQQTDGALMDLGAR
jgi:hypothetical protein